MKQAYRHPDFGFIDAIFYATVAWPFIAIWGISELLHDAIRLRPGWRWFGWQCLGFVLWPTFIIGDWYKYDSDGNRRQSDGTRSSE